MMLLNRVMICGLVLLFTSLHTTAQLVINEGSNKNFQTLTDNDSENPDWIELYNAGPSDISLGTYYLTDDSVNTTKWPLPQQIIPAFGYATIFCSAKNRYPIAPFTPALNTGAYTPSNGWNEHLFTTPYEWDGVSNIIINICSYSSLGYTANSVVQLTNTTYASSLASVNDGNDAACSANNGAAFYRRPVIKLNGITIGTADSENSPTDYPAPYGNWYWCARHQFLIPASELQAAGLTAGPVTSLAFNVITSDNALYDYIDISLGPSTMNSLSNVFQSSAGNDEWHTNFKIDAQGERIYLYNDAAQVISSLLVKSPAIDYSNGLHPDGSTNVRTFLQPTPGETNNNSETYNSFTPAPVLSVPSGFYAQVQLVSITCADTTASIYYTTNGNEPDTSDQLYTGSPIYVVSSSAVRARAYAPGKFPSTISSSSVLINVNHTTPILSVITDNSHLYGPQGIFDNVFQDWEKPAEAIYFDSTKQVIFSSPAAMRMDGGAGGSRTHPQRSFRLNFADGVMGYTPINYPFIPDRPQRNIYSNIYMRNGSNQFNVLPYKDACQVQAMCKELNAYYSAYRPVSVYINGSYFGLYELREKLDDEFFIQNELADPEQLHILGLSYYYGSVLRAQNGSTDTFFNDYNNWAQLNPSDSAYWPLADHYFDLNYYTDYIIGQTWMGNVDWPGNNIKIYKSNKTNHRWRFATIDLELAMAPNSWTDCYSDNVQYILGQSSDNPYINIFLKSIQHQRFRNYFINRFADVMNVYYNNDLLAQREENIFNWVLPEMPNQFYRWGDPNNVTELMNGFIQNHLVFRDQLLLRSAIVQDHLVGNFQLGNKLPVTLNTVPPEGGTIAISTITPEQYPWTGTYFNNVPIGIKATPAPGYSFSHWEPNAVLSDTLNATFVDTLNSTDAITFTAHFKPLITQVNQVPAVKTTIYPIPATDRLYVLVNSLRKQGWSIEILDHTGRVLLQKNMTSDEAEYIDVKGFIAGCYLLKVFDSGTLCDSKQVMIVR